MLLNYMVRNIFIITVGDMFVSTLCDDNLIYYLARAIASRYALRVGLFRRDVLQTSLLNTPSVASLCACAYGSRF